MELYFIWSASEKSVQTFLMSFLMEIPHSEFQKTDLRLYTEISLTPEQEMTVSFCFECLILSISSVM